MIQLNANSPALAARKTNKQEEGEFVVRRVIGLQINPKQNQVIALP